LPERSDVTDFFELVDEAERHPTQRWDFTWLSNRITADHLPWDFANIVAGLARTSPDLLDLGTGGVRASHALGNGRDRVQ
jgi:hypothetical protein